MATSPSQAWFVVERDTCSLPCVRMSRACTVPCSAWRTSPCAVVSPLEFRSFVRSFSGDWPNTYYLSNVLLERWDLSGNNRQHVLTHIKRTFESGEKVSKCYAEKCHGRHRGGEEGREMPEVEEGRKEGLWGRRRGGGI